MKRPTRGYPTMSFDHFDRFFAFAAAGLGLLLAGGLNLALGRGGRRVWLRLVLTVAACGAVCAGLGAITRPALAFRAAGLQAGVLAMAAVLGSAWLTRQIASLAAFFCNPLPRWGLVALGGLGVLLASGLAFDQVDEAATDQAMKDMEMATERPEAKPTDRIASTDRGGRIVLKEPLAHREDTEWTSVEGRMINESPFREQIIRRAGATDYSNCHGWVFTGGKYLLSTDDVEAIVRENGYHETHEPHPGDLVIYRQNEKIAHSAVVRYVSEGQPVLVEGKWGAMGVFMHPADKSFYGTNYTFYRSARRGHLLVGLGGSPAPADATNATAE